MTSFELPNHLKVNYHFYRPQRSCGKVMFSQASGILFTGRGGACVRACPWGTNVPPRHTRPQACTPPRHTCLPPDGQCAGGTHPTGMQSCSNNRSFPQETCVCIMESIPREHQISHCKTIPWNMMKKPVIPSFVVHKDHYNQ